jgi:hypothetical protein
MRRNIIFILTMLTINACSDVKNQLGLHRKSPDEFTIIQNQPLHIPPKLDSLPNPDQSGKSNFLDSFNNKAKKQEGKLSKGDQEFLNQIEKSGK